MNITKFLSVAFITLLCSGAAMGQGLTQQIKNNAKPKAKTEAKAKPQPAKPQAQQPTATKSSKNTSSKKNSSKTVAAKSTVSDPKNSIGVWRRDNTSRLDRVKQGERVQFRTFSYNYPMFDTDNLSDIIYNNEYVIYCDKKGGVYAYNGNKGTYFIIYLPTKGTSSPTNVYFQNSSNDMMVLETYEGRFLYDVRDDYVTSYSDDRLVTRTKKMAEVVVQEKKKEEAFKTVEQMPQFPGGDAALMRYLYTHIQYPTLAQEHNIQGTVVVQFLVTKDGSITEVKVVRSVDKDLDREAVRVCKTLPKFTPGRQDGQAVNVWYTLPVQFKLQ